MDLILEILAEFLTGGGEPPANRTLLLLFTVGGLALAIASGWLVTNGVDVVHAPAWKIGVAMGPLAPWGLFWSYIVILHAFMEAFLRSGREDVIAAFSASPLLRRRDSTPLATPGLEGPAYTVSKR